MASAARTARSELFSSRDRVPEQSHQSVAERLGDASAHLRHCGRGRVEVGAEQIAPILDVETGRKAGRSDKIAEHHGDGPALGRKPSGVLGRATRARGSIEKRRAGQLPDRDEQPAPIADRRDADPPEIFRRHMTKNVLVDPVLAKSRLRTRSSPRLRSHPPRSMAGLPIGAGSSPSGAAVSSVPLIPWVEIDFGRQPRTDGESWRRRADRKSQRSAIDAALAFKRKVPPAAYPIRPSKGLL